MLEARKSVTSSSEVVQALGNPWSGRTGLWQRSQLLEEVVNRYPFPGGQWVLEDWHTGDGIQTEVWVVCLRLNLEPEVRKRRTWLSHRLCKEHLAEDLPTLRAQTSQRKMHSKRPWMDVALGHQYLPLTGFTYPHGVHLKVFSCACCPSLPCYSQLKPQHFLWKRLTRIQR